MKDYVKLTEKFYPDGKFWEIELTDEREDSIVKIPLIKNYVYDGYYDVESPYGYCGPRIVKGMPGNWIITSFKHEMLINNVVAGFIRFNPFDKYNIYRYFKDETVQIERVRDIAIWQREKKSDGFEVFYKNIHPSKKNKFNISVKKEVEVIISDNCKAFIDGYYRMLDRKRANNFYYFDKNYFHMLCRLKDVKLFLALRKGNVLGGVLFIYDDGLLFYHLSFVEEEAKRFGVATSLIVNGVRYFLERNDLYDVNTVVFGGGNSSDDRDSLLRFKRDFSNRLVPYYIGKIIFNRDIYNNWRNVLPVVNSNRFIFYR